MKNTLLVIILTFSVTIFASPFVKPSEPNGKLNFSQTHISKNIFPVSLYYIDGKQIIKRNNAVWLKPGKHSIRVSSVVNLNSRSKSLRKRIKYNIKNQNNTLEINVEKDKTYYVGLDTNDSDPNKWHPVVWKVK